MGSTNVQDGREGCLTPLRKLPVGDHADFFAASWPDRMGLNVYMVFEAVPRKKAGFQRINIQTELWNSELKAPDNVWVRGVGKCAVPNVGWSPFGWRNIVRLLWSNDV